MSGLSLGGLISGANTDDLIYKLMQIERQRVYQQEARQKTLEAKQKAWRDIRTSLTSIQSKLDPLRLPTIFRSRKVNLTDDSVATVTAASGAAQTSHSLKVERLAQSHMITQMAGTERAAHVPLGYEGTFQLGTQSSELKSIEVTAEDTLSSLASKINAAKSGVRADLVTIGENQYRLVLTSSKSGEASAISLVDGPPGADSKTLFGDLLGMVDVDGKPTKVLSQAQDAKIELNGQADTSATNTFDNILPGISVTAKKPSTDLVQATVAMDLDKVVQSVKDWVSAVNSAQDQLKKLSSWDGDAKTAGVLNGESLVRSLQYYLRQPFSTVVEDLPASLNQLSQVGVATGAYGTADYGKIVVDEQKLREALERDIEGVVQLFNTGPATQMHGYVRSVLDVEHGGVETREKGLTEQIKRIRDTIDRIELQLVEREKVLRMQFARMEEAMAKLKSQGNAFAMQMMGFMQ